MSKTDSANDSQDKDHSSVLEPNIVFYKQNSNVDGSLSKVLGDLTFTEDSGCISRPTINLSKVDSDCTKDEALYVSAEVKTESQNDLKRSLLGSLPKPKSLLGKRTRSSLEDDLNQLFDQKLP